jgi:hypothetical protein
MSNHKQRGLFAIHCALAAALVAALAACGGGDPQRAIAQAGDERAHALAVPGVIITEQPRSAAVASGSGVAFSVVTSVQRKVITGYLWHRDGHPVFRDTRTSDRSTYSIASVGAAQAGTYTVRVLTTVGTLDSNKATLSIIAPGDWAQLGGRSIATSGTAQQPSLALCDQPTMAWIDGGGASRLRVSRFTGTQWIAMGAALNVSSSGVASEPSLDCVADAATGARRPVVAWSETVATGGRAIQVKAWNGASWISVLGDGGPISGTNARWPVLRLAPIESASAVTPPPIIHSRSALAWVEGSSLAFKVWNGVAWQLYLNAHPLGANQGAAALALDEARQQGSFNTYPPLLAHVTPLPSFQTALSVEANVAGWDALGQPSPLSPAASPLTVTGIGFGNDSFGVGPGAVAVWTAGSSAYTISSSQLFGSDYEAALNLQLNPAWAAFAYPFTGVDLHALSFDPHALSTRCLDGGSRPTFALAVNDSRGTRVLSARCNGSGTDPMDWTALQRALIGTASGLSLRMESDTVPVVAVSASANDLFELSVWRFFP